jgi:hypothetical protein
MHFCMPGSKYIYEDGKVLRKRTNGSDATKNAVEAVGEGFGVVKVDG